MLINKKKGGGDQKRFRLWRILKTEFYRFSVDGKKRAFQKHWLSQLIKYLVIVFSIVGAIEAW